MRKVNNIQYKILNWITYACITLTFSSENYNCHSIFLQILFLDLTYLSMATAASCLTLTTPKLARARRSSFPAAITFSQLASEPCIIHNIHLLESEKFTCTNASKQTIAMVTTINPLKDSKST